MIDPLSGEDVYGRDRRDDPVAARLPLLSPAALDEAQRVVYEAVAGRPGGDGSVPCRRVDAGVPEGEPAPRWPAADPG